MTRDHDLANTILYPLKQFHGIIILHAHPEAEKIIIEAESLLTKVKEYGGKLLNYKESKERSA